MTMNAALYIWTAEDQQVIVSGDPTAFMNPANDPGTLSVFRTWSTSTGHDDVFNLVQFAPYFEQAQYYREGWDDLDRLLAMIDGWFGGTEFETFKEIVSAHDEERRDDAFRYVNEQALAIEEAMRTVREAFLQAVNEVRLAALAGPSEATAAVPSPPVAGAYETATTVTPSPPVPGGYEAATTVTPSPPVPGGYEAATTVTPSPPVPGASETATTATPAPPAAGGAPAGEWQVPTVVTQVEVIEQVEMTPETVKYSEPMPSLDQVVDWDTMLAEDQRALKDAQEVGTRLPFWQLGEWVLLGPGQPAEYYEAFDARGAQHGEVTIISRGSTFGRDPGLVQVRGSTDPGAFRTTIGRFSKKRLEFA